MKIQFITGDIPALAMICQTKQNGYASCRKCFIYGDRRGIPKVGKPDKDGNETIYLANARTCFGYHASKDAARRTDDDFRFKTQPETHLKNTDPLDESEFQLSPFEREFI